MSVDQAVDACYFLSYFPLMLNYVCMFAFISSYVQMCVCRENNMNSLICEIQKPQSGQIF